LGVKTTLRRTPIRTIGAEGCWFEMRVLLLNSGHCLPLAEWDGRSSQGHKTGLAGSGANTVDANQIVAIALS